MKDREREQRRGFTYVPRSADSVKKRAERKVGRYDSPFLQQFDVFTPKVGENVIRFLPPTWPNHEHYGYDVWMHRYVGPDNSNYLCLRMENKEANCPICTAAKEARDAGEQEEAAQLAASNLVVTWIINRDADDATPMVYVMGARLDRDIVALCHSKRTGKVLLLDHPNEGYDVIIRREGQGLKTRYTASIERDPSAISENDREQEKILDYIQENPIPSTFHFYDPDYLEKMISGTAEAKDVDLDAEERDREERAGRHDREEPRSRERDLDAEDAAPARSERRARDRDEDEETKPWPPKRARGEDDEDQRARPERDRDREEERPAKRARDEGNGREEPRRARPPADDEDDEETGETRARDDRKPAPRGFQRERVGRE